MKRFGLIGKTLKHSFSKNYFTQKFKNQNSNDCRYDNFELQSIEEFSPLLNNNPNLQGLNITIPYKEEIISFLDEMDETVKKIKACNCIKVSGGKLFGFNTDVAGFTKSLQPELQPHHKKALILGSGGSSKAVQYALKEIGIEYTVVSRRKKNDEIGYEDIDDAILSQYTLLINTTPVGMFPNINNDPPIPYEYLTSKHFLFDLIYNPAKTKFLEKGEKQGAQIANGHEMLILQAEESWRIWNE